MSKRLEAIERMARGEVPQAPVARLIGFELTSIRHGESVIELEASDSHANPMGTLHGGILCDIADAAMGIAFASTLDDGESFTTLELKINFLRPAVNGTLMARAQVVHAGLTQATCQCNIFVMGDGKEKLVAVAQGTVNRLGEGADGTSSSAGGK